MNVRDAIEVLSAGQNILYVVLTVKMWRDGLISKYKMFAIFILLQLVSGLVRLGFRPGTDSYAWYYFISQPFLITGAFFAISEVYTLVLKEFPGLATLGHRVLPISVVLAVLLSGMTLFIRWSAEKSPFPYLEAYLTSEHFLYGSILVTVLLISAYLLWFPVPLSRNVVLHSALFASYLLVHTSTRIFLVAMGKDVLKYVNLLQMGVSAACLVIWIALLSPKGDTILVKAGAPHWSPAQEDRLLTQLDALNATLQSSAKK